MTEPMHNEGREEVLTLHDANSLPWRDLDVSALESQVQAVWETVESMQEAQTVRIEMLMYEISV